MTLQSIIPQLHIAIQVLSEKEFENKLFLTIFRKSAIIFAIDVVVHS